MMEGSGYDETENVDPKQLVWSQLQAHLLTLAEDRCQGKSATLDERDVQSFRDALVIDHPPISLSCSVRRNLTDRDFPYDRDTTRDRMKQTDQGNDAQLEVGGGFNFISRTLQSARVRLQNNSFTKWVNKENTSVHERGTDGARTVLTTRSMAESGLIECRLKISRSMRIKVLPGDDKVVGTVAGKMPCARACVTVCVRVCVYVVVQATMHAQRTYFACGFVLR